MKAFPHVDLAVLAVWISMMNGDTHEAAQKASGNFRDGRVEQFYDPGRLSGRAFATILGHEGKTAWDIYMFYPRREVWRELPPRPQIYMHQLRDGWADQSRLFEGDLLRTKLLETMQSLFSTISEVT